MDKRLEKALERADAFMAERPEYSREGVKQLGQGNTNRVIYARHGDKPVVIKVFSEKQRKERECFAYKHWASTGLVAELIDESDPRIAVVSMVPGENRHLQDYSPEQWAATCRNLSEALGSLSQVPLSNESRERFESQFYEYSSLESYLGRLMELGKSIHEKDADFQDDFWAESLEFMEDNLDTIYSQPRILYNQDPNCHADERKFHGFFDLEMCRVGTAAMQFASAMKPQLLRSDGWHSFVEGWKQATELPLIQRHRKAIFAAKQLLSWREISRYMSYDGTPGTGYKWASPADPEYYRNEFQSARKLLLG